MHAWIGWAVPVLLLVALVATLLVNRRRFRAQRFGTLSERRAVPTGLVAGHALAMTAVSLGIVIVIASVVLVTEGRGFDSTWWTFAIIGVAVLTAGLLGRARFGRALRSVRRPLD